MIKQLTILSILTFLFILAGCEKDSTDIPSTVDRDKFLGSWRAYSYAPGDTFNFNMNITASNSAPEQILMENFDGYGSGTFITADVNGSSFVIPRNIIASDTIQGSGNYNSNNTLTFQFTVRDGQTVENRSGVAFR